MVISNHVNMEGTTISKKLFGGMIDFVIYDAPEDIAENIVEEAYLEGLRLQKIFNFYDPESELSSLNRSRKAVVSDELLHLLKKSLQISELTHGSYDVSLGKYILSRKQGRIIEPKCSYKDIVIDGNEVNLANPEVLIDLGSIAKGYIADKLAEFLLENGLEEFLVDARGDICVRGDRDHILGIQNPRNQGVICRVKLNNQAVATSGDYLQYSKNFETSHIINQKDLVSVTVIAETAEEADLYATAIFTSSSEDTEKIIEGKKDIKVLTIKKGDNLKMSNGFEQMVYHEK